MLFLLIRAVGFRLLLCLVLLIRFRRFVAHDEKGSSCNPQSQRGVGRPRLLLRYRSQPETRLLPSFDSCAPAHLTLAPSPTRSPLPSRFYLLCRFSQKAHST